MKNYYIFALFFLSSMAHSQIVNIPDANFKNALVNTLCVDTNSDNIGDTDADTNNDGEIQVNEAAAVLNLVVSGQNISSLEGIHNFTNLEKLLCHQNQITILEFTQNPNLKDLICYENQLTSIDVTQNPNLERIWCPNNQLTSLNVSQNPNLNDLLCAFNQITSLDVTHNAQLEYLGCHGNQLTSLDVSQNTSLETLYCDENSITSLDISQNPNIESLVCRENQLTSLNIRNGNNHNMRTMWAYTNPNLLFIQVDCVDEANARKCNSGFTWCKDSTASYIGECTLGTEDFNEISIKLYPNPTQGILYIDSRQAIDSVSIYSVTGNLIKHTSSSKINVADLPAGLFFVKVYIMGKTITKKFIKS